MIELCHYQNSHFSRGVPIWKEGLWWGLRSLLFASWFPIPSGIKVMALRLVGASVGKGVVIRSRVNITFPWRVKIGDFVWIGDEVFILSLADVLIGNNVCLSQRAFLCTGSHDFEKSTFDLITKPIVIGDGCWIGAQCFVGPGITFGSESRAMAGAVVIKDVESGTTVAGVPAAPKLVNRKAGERKD